MEKKLGDSQTSASPPSLVNRSNSFAALINQQAPLYCVHRLLRGAFARYGLLVARRPLPFVIIPALIAASLAIGMIRLHQVTSSEYLFTPTNGPAKDERQTATHLFPMNDTTEFDGLRLSNFGRFVHLLIMPKTASVKTVIQEDVMREMIRLAHFVRNNSSPFPYQQVCGKKEGDCVLDSLLQLIYSNESRFLQRDFTFPVAKSDNGDFLFLGNNLGGLQYVNDTPHHIASAAAARIAFWLTDSEESNEWEKTVLEHLQDFHSDVIDFKPLTSQAIDTEMEKATKAVIPLFTISFTLLITFAVTSLVMRDWVRTKLVLGLLGVLSPALAVAATVGFLSAIGVDFCSVVGSMPFLVMGIGVDDMFIIVEAYRHTKPEDTVEKRMSDTFANAAVSITMTSFTDFLGFAIAAVTFFPSVYLFCLYTALAVIFDYILQITFFAALMTYDTRREHTNRHAVTLQVVLPKSESKEKSRTYRICCSGGVKKDGKIVAKEEEHLASKVIRRFYGPLLVKRPVKVAVMAMFAIYLAVSIYGCTRVNQGVELKNLARDDSDTHIYFDRQAKFFVEYGLQIMFMKTQTVDYWNDTVQRDIDKAITEVINTKYVGAVSQRKITWWLHDFLEFMNKTRGPGAASLGKSETMNILRTQFLQHPFYRQYKLDIRFNDDGTAIEATRFFIQTNNLTDAELDRGMMTTFRNIAESHGLVAYHPQFIYYDQYTAVLPNTLQNIGIALIAMLVVSILIIPHLLCAFLTVLAILSVDVGVIGIMQFWGVNVDVISMINLVLCIGFSVDFCAHITYAFMVSKFNTRDERAVDALNQLGYPIVQGAISTILGVLPLAFSHTYILRTFFKTLFLVITFGFLHGIVVLPVVMSIIGPTGKFAVQIDDIDANAGKRNPLFDLIYENKIESAEFEETDIRRVEEIQSSSS